MNSDIKQKEMKKILPFIVALFFPLALIAQDITYAEYFIDTDPGFGEAASIPVSAPGADLTLSFTAGLQALDPGIHQIFLRAKNDSEKWGPVVFSTFYVVEIPSPGELNIQEMEYFIDTDPGYGKAIPISVATPGTDLSFNFTADLTALSPGIHQIFFRGKNGSGEWGVMAHGTFFTIDIPASGVSQIQQLEYFIDTDPGYGNATQVSLPSSGTDLQVDFDVSLDGLTGDDHVLFVRAKNDLMQWGQLFMEAFTLSSNGEDPEEFHSLFKLYPNPASTHIIIEITDQTHASVPIRISDLHGAVVFETQCVNHPCIIEPNLPGGIYLISIKIDKHQITQKIVIE